MERTEQNRYIGVLCLFQLSCQIIHCKQEEFIFLCALYHDIGSYKIGLFRISCLVPSYCRTNCIICHCFRYIDMPACSCNTALIVYPVNHTVCCPCIPCIQRAGFSKVKATDCWKLATQILNKVKFIITRNTIKFLLTRNHTLSINTGKIRHQGLCFLRCLWVTKGIGRLQFCKGFRCNCHIVKLCPAPEAFHLNGVFSGSQLHRSCFNLCKAACCREGHIRLADTVYLELLSLIAICLIADIQVVHTSFFYIHSYGQSFSCILHENILTATC